MRSVIFLFKNHLEVDGKSLVPDIVFLFKKVLYEDKVKWLAP